MPPEPRRWIRAVRLAVIVALALPGVACAESGDACSLRAGRATHEIEVEGTTRRYHVVVGSGAEASGPAPLVLLWHGWGDRGSSFLRAPDLERLWPEAVAVAAEGLPRRFPGMGGSQAGWQIEPGELGDRDLAFFDALLEDVSQRYCVDRSRVTSAGFSNGGYFSNLLGCVRGTRLAAIAPVGGGGPVGEPECGDAIPVLVQHGERDPVVAFASGRTSFESWARRNGCDAPEPDAASGCRAATGCSAETRLCATNAAHTWPPGTSERMVEFLRAQRRSDGSR